MERGRESAAKRGYDHHWNTVVRPAALAREPLCRFCLEKGRVRAACVVDHIDGNSRNNDPSNLRSLCKTCHDRRTARDQGFARTASFYPKGLRRGKSPVAIVCGPPCAGKSTHIKNHKQDGDLVIDWDNISFAVAGVPMFALPQDRIPQAVFYRNQILSRLPDIDTRMVWLEESGQKRHQRQHFLSALGGSIVVIETPPEVCSARVVADPRRDARPGARSAPEIWWEGYTVDYADARIS